MSLSEEEEFEQQQHMILRKWEKHAKYWFWTNDLELKLADLTTRETNPCFAALVMLCVRHRSFSAFAILYAQELQDIVDLGDVLLPT